MNINNRYFETTGHVRAWFDICQVILSKSGEGRKFLEQAAEAAGYKPQALINRITCQVPYHKYAPALSTQKRILDAFGMSYQYKLNGIPVDVEQVDGLFYAAIEATYGSFYRAAYNNDIYESTRGTKQRSHEKTPLVLNRFGKDLEICLTIEIEGQELWVLGDYTAEQKAALHEEANENYNYNN
jgi:hypothetical protein